LFTALTGRDAGAAGRVWAMGSAGRSATNSGGRLGATSPQPATSGAAAQSASRIRVSTRPVIDFPS
jgi:hypothetical protein